MVQGQSTLNNEHDLVSLSITTYTLQSKCLTQDVELMPEKAALRALVFALPVKTSLRLGGTYPKCATLSLRVSKMINFNMI